MFSNTPILKFLVISLLHSVQSFIPFESSKGISRKAFPTSKHTFGRLDAELINNEGLESQIISCLVTYVFCIGWFDRPRGELVVSEESLIVKQSCVEGAGLGLFAGRTIEKGTVLGTYPGVVLPINVYKRKLRNFYCSSDYVWVNNEQGYVIDPTDEKGLLSDYCTGGTDSYPLSVFILRTLFGSLRVPTKLARINEPPLGSDCNVLSVEIEDKQKVRFVASREIFEGEELYIDYGKNYDRSKYSS